MNEMIRAAESGMTLIDVLAHEARECVRNFKTSAMELGRILNEAKPIVKQNGGSWEQWVRDNTQLSLRNAQQFMAIYREFGNNASVDNLESTKLVKMLLLPEGTKEQFIESHDLEHMTSREVEAAVKEAVATERAKWEREQSAKQNDKGIPDSVLNELREKQDAINRLEAERERLVETAQESVAGAQESEREKCRLMKYADEMRTMAENADTENQRLKDELANARSAIAKGDADRKVSSKLSADMLAGAVRQFVGACAQMPHMGREFAVMAKDERSEYERLLKTVEGWCKQSRKAISMVEAEGDVQ